MSTSAFSNVGLALQGLHLLCATLWLGSLVYTEWILWPHLRELGLESLRAKLRSIRMRQKMGIAIVGTLVTGYARGAVDGVFDRLMTPYGVLFLVAAILVTASVVWWLMFPTRDRKLGWHLYYASFVPVFVLMIAMRAYAPH
jgi:uncharacterized membrane protein